MKILAAAKQDGIGLESDHRGKRDCHLLPLARLVLWLGLVWALLAGAGAQTNAPAGPERWEKEVAAFERQDKTNAPLQQGILFVGSSSIRLWKTLTNDFAGFPVAQRGVGGCQMADVLYYARRIIDPYQPNVVIVYAGDNDIAAGKTPQQVTRDFQALVAHIQHTRPDTRIGFLAIKPSIARWKYIEQIRQANQQIQTWAAQQRHVDYIDLFTPMLNSEKTPRPELFEKDNLHVNREGYALWTKIIRDYLRKLPLAGN